MIGSVSRSPHLVALAALLLSIFTPPIARADEMIYFPIGTGAIAGTYYPIGTLIARIISHPPGSRACEDGGTCGVPNLVAAAQSSHGSVANAQAIQNGQILSGFSQADVAHDAHKGEGAFSGVKPLDKIRALANLYPENLHVVVSRASGIKNISGLKGMRVSLDVPGSGTLVAARIVLDAYGLRDGDLIAEYMTSGQAATVMRRGQLDAFFIVAGTPASAVTALTRDGLASVIPLEAEKIDAILANHRFFTRSAIGADIYDQVGQVPTIAVGAQWLVSADAPEQLVNDVCRALWNDGARTALDQGHPQGRHIRLETALDGIAIPLHPGAARCYRDLGLIK